MSDPIQQPFFTQSNGYAGEQGNKKSPIQYESGKSYMCRALGSCSGLMRWGWVNLVSQLAAILQKGKASEFAMVVL